METLTPSHYAKLPSQPLDFILANKLGFCEGNIIKYVCRYPYKCGLEDLKKARHYLEKLIERQEVKELVKRPT